MVLHRSNFETYPDASAVRVRVTIEPLHNEAVTASALPAT
jgi:hypothetical protein